MGDGNRREEEWREEEVRGDVREEEEEREEMREEEGRGTVDPDWADHSSGEEQLSSDSTEQL